VQSSGIFFDRSEDGTFKSMEAIAGTFQQPATKITADGKAIFPYYSQGTISIHLVLK